MRLSRVSLAQNTNKWVIDPRKSKFLGWWDFVAVLAILYTTIVTPAEVRGRVEWEGGIYDGRRGRKERVERERE